VAKGSISGVDFFSPTGGRFDDFDTHAPITGNRPGKTRKPPHLDCYVAYDWRDLAIALGFFLFGKVQH